MKLSANGIQLIKTLETFVPHIYPDADGFSIGYGTFLFTTAQIQAYTGKTITEAEATDLLIKRAAPLEVEVSNAVKVPLTQNQFDALISFAYNVGFGAFQGSTLLKKLNAKDYAGAAAQFDRWNKSKGQIKQALVDRRKKEKELFNKCDSTPTQPSPEITSS